MKKPFAVRLSDEQKKALKQIADADDRSVSAIIRRIINEYIRKHKNEHL